VGNLLTMADELDVDAMIQRFRDRAKAVRNRGVPPLEGEDRKRFIEQARYDYMDYAMLADAEATLDDGILTLRVDLRPKPD
jgi:limonene-1,2-epoxide hydrolase